MVDLTLYLQHSSTNADLNFPGIIGTVGGWYLDEDASIFNAHSFYHAVQDVEGLQLFQSSGNMSEWQFYVYGRPITGSYN